MPVHYPRQCGSALHDFRCLLPPRSVAVHCNIFTAQRAKVVWCCIKGFPLLAALKQCGSPLQADLAPYPQVDERCIAGNPLPTAPRAIWHCSATVLLPPAPRQRNGAVHESDRALRTGTVAVHCSNSATHFRQAVRQCITAVALPPTPGQCGNALQQFDRALPLGIVAVHCSSSVTYFLHVAGQYIVPLSSPADQGGMALHYSSSAA